jgi:hypothetical protein
VSVDFLQRGSDLMFIRPAFWPAFGQLNPEALLEAGKLFGKLLAFRAACQVGYQPGLQGSIQPTIRCHLQSLAG